MAASEVNLYDKPQQSDLDKCVHCGLCLNACPTYRELRVEMDSPRGRIYQMAQVASGTVEIGPSYIEHIDLCLACRGCETACPSGVQYGRLVEAARAEIESKVRRPWKERLIRHIVFRKLLPSRFNLTLAGAALYFYQASGLKRLVRTLGFLPRRLREMESLAPEMETPFFYRYYGSVQAAEGAKRYRVAFLGGCIANLSFARLNEATVRVLRKNGCEVSIPPGQGCCGALHVHAGMREEARVLARRNIDALLDGNYDAILTNAGGCGSTLKEYGELLEHDPEYAEKARRFSALHERCDGISGVDRTEPKSACGKECCYVPGFLPFGAWAENPVRAQDVAGVRAWIGTARDAVVRLVLWKRGYLQRGPHRHGDGAA